MLKMAWMSASRDSFLRKTEMMSEQRVQCDLCPRFCRLKEGEYGICGVRRAEKGRVIHANYGILSSIHVDPIEKKPLHHFLPASRSLSIGSFGCNLFCRGCQNASISRCTAQDGGGFKLSAQEIIALAQKHRCASVAYTYNEPIVWAEFMSDTAEVVQSAGLKTVMVTAGYVSPSARDRVFAHIDAANVDLKGFSSAFYRSWAKAELEPVLETLEFLHEKRNCWLEITMLLIEGVNDNPSDLEKAFEWIVEHLGIEVPLHLSAFHPAYHAMEIQRTSVETLSMARDLALKTGILYVYLGNVACSVDTMCPRCHQTLIRRMGYQTEISGLYQGCCCQCGQRIAGVW